MSKLNEFTGVGAIPAIDGIGLGYQPKPAAAKKKKTAVSSLVGDDDEKLFPSTLKKTESVVSATTPPVAPVEVNTEKKIELPSKVVENVKIEVPVKPVQESLDISQFFRRQNSGVTYQPAAPTAISESQAAAMASTLVAETITVPGAGMGEALMRGGELPPPNQEIDRASFISALHQIMPRVG